MLLRSSLDRIDLSGNRKKEDVDMIGIISTVFALLGLLMTWSLAKATSDADKRIEQFYQTFLLGEESQDGSSSKKVQQTA